MLLRLKEGGEMTFNETYNPCDECDYSYSKNNQDMGMCKICEFKQLLEEAEQKLKVNQNDNR